jgi:hypothetical protein
MEDKRGAYCRCFLALVLAWVGVSRLQGFAQTAEASDKSVRNRLAVTPAVGLTKTQQTTQARILGSYGKLPLSFEGNQGQTDFHAKFLSRGSGYTLFLTPTDAVLAFRKPISSNNHAGKKGLAVPPAAKGGAPAADVFRMRLVGANPKPVIAGAEELPGKSNYFIGNDPKKWHQRPDLRQGQIRERLSGDRPRLLREPGSTRIRLCRCARRRPARNQAGFWSAGACSRFLEAKLASLASIQLQIAGASSGCSKRQQPATLQGAPSSGFAPCGEQ